VIKEWLRCAKAGRFDAPAVAAGGRAYDTGSARLTAEPDDMAGGGFLLR
jgi:hypothetical protein